MPAHLFSKKTNELEELNYRCLSLNGQCRTQEAQIETMTAQNAEKDAEIEALTAKNAEKDAEIEAMTAESIDPEDLSSVKEGTYRSTKRFIKEITDRNFHYTFRAASSKGDDDVVSMSFENSSSNGLSFDYTATIFFESNNDAMCMRAWNLIDFQQSNLSAVRKVCDEMNNRYKWVKFSVDERDYSVSASFDIILVDVPEMGEAMWDALDIFDGVLASAYDYFYKYSI